MGIGHAKNAEITWRHLPPIPRLILNHMAFVPWDTNPDPCYWAGHDNLITTAMGKDLPEDLGHKFRCGCLTCRRRKTLYELLRRQLNILIKAGAIEPLGRDLHWPHATYRLHVLHSRSGALPRAGSGAAPPQERGNTPPGERGIGVSKEVTKEIGRGSRSPEATTSPAAVDNPEPKIDPSPGLCPHGNPAGLLGGPGTEPRCRQCREAARDAR